MDKSDIAIQIADYEVAQEDDTQFDFYLKTTTGDSYSFEVKYTEDDFGTTTVEGHHEKWINIYKDKVDKLTGKDKVSEEDFFANYQLWRNIIFTIERNHYTCFLYPKFRNDDLSESVKKIMDKCKSLDKNKVIIINADDFVEKILNSPDFSEKLKNHYKIFSEKYLEI